MASKAAPLFEEHERQAWLPPPDLPIDQWAEENLVLPRDVSGSPGPLSLNLSPYLREPLRAVTDPETFEVTLCTSSQVGKTTFLLIVFLYFLAVDPWNAHFVMPSEDDANEINRERFQPIIKASPAFDSLRTGARGEMVEDAIRMNGMTISFRGANSPAGLSSKPSKLAAADEVDKWPAWAGKEAPPLELLGERMKTFHDSKFLKSSTPTTKYGYVWQELHQGSNERYWVACPHCTERQVLVFGNGKAGPGIKWPKDTSPVDIDQGNLAWYECAHCERKIHERHKKAMVTSGEWHPDSWKPGDPPTQKRHRSFHIWAGYSLWPGASWSKIARKFLEAKGTPGKLMNFVNSWQGHIWEVTHAEMTAATVRERQGEYVTRETAETDEGSAIRLPEGAYVVTIAADVQSTGIGTYQYFVVRAWGAGGKSWLIDYGATSPQTSWSKIASLAQTRRYVQANGDPATVIRPLIDSGYRTKEVYDVCLQEQWIPTKGDARSRQHIRQSDVQVSQDSDTTIELVSFNPDFYKTALHREMRNATHWNLPANVDEEYFHHMTAEQQIAVVDKATGKNKIKWQLKSSGLPNHYFDCEVLQLVVADLADLHSLGPPEGVRTRQRDRQAPTPTQPGTQQPATIGAGASRMFS